MGSELHLCQTIKAGFEGKRCGSSGGVCRDRDCCYPPFHSQEAESSPLSQANISTLRPCALLTRYGSWCWISVLAVYCRSLGNRPVCHTSPYPNGSACLQRLTLNSSGVPEHLNLASYRAASFCPWAVHPAAYLVSAPAL